MQSQQLKEQFPQQRAQRLYESPVRFGLRKCCGRSRIRHSTAISKTLCPEIATDRACSFNAYKPLSRRRALGTLAEERLESLVAALNNLAKVSEIRTSNAFPATMRSWR